MMDAYSQISTRATPQSERADERQVKNSAGGFVFSLDDEARLRRFLLLGSEGGTHYASAKDQTFDNAGVLLRMAKTNPQRMVAVITEISVAGRAPKANPALFALAIVAAQADEAGRKAAFAAVPAVVRTGTHLFLFAGYLQNFRGWGRGVKRAIAGWYQDRDVKDLAYQMVKYRQREGWSHADLLRLSHPKTTDPARTALYRWSLGKTDNTDAVNLPRLVFDFETLQVPGLSAKSAATIVAGNQSISWEMLPDAMLGSKEVWEALLPNMPATALMRQLPRLTNLGLLTGDLGKDVAKRLADPERLLKARVHPINILVAQRTYASGQSARGDGSWVPQRRIVDALDAAFYAAFGAVEPTGKRTMLALDVSGSMAMQPISNMPLTPREASAAMALVTASVEDDCEIVGFTGDPTGRFNGYFGVRSSGSQESLAPLSLSPRQRLDDAISAISGLPFGPTDCAQPMIYAMKHGLEIDTFVIYTDNETWSGSVHPHQALKTYRQKSGIDARLVVVGMTATEFSIADPDDTGMLDVVGFDSATPSLISEFARGL